MKRLTSTRCYSVSRIPVDGGRELVLYNLHLSAYTSDGTIATEQLSLLLRDMQREYEKGNWCVAGGDFNKDLLGDSAQYFGAADQAYSWAQPSPMRPSTALPCVWLRRSTNRILCRAAATPTARIMRDSMF